MGTRNPGLAAQFEDPPLRLRLCGQDPDQLRTMLVDWYFRPLASNLLRLEPRVGCVYLVVRAGREGPATHQVIAAGTVDAEWPVHDPLPVDGTIGRLRRRYFGAASPDVLEPYSLSAAVRPCCRWDGMWTPFVVLRRGQKEPQGLAVLHRREEYWDPGMPTPVAGRTVDQMVESLEMLDAGAQLLWKMELALDAVDALPNHPNEHHSVEWAIKQLEWMLGPEG